MTSPREMFSRMRTWLIGVHAAILRLLVTARISGSGSTYLVCRRQDNDVGTTYSCVDLREATLEAPTRVSARGDDLGTTCSCVGVCKNDLGTAYLARRRVPGIPAVAAQ